jgi:hypothetical protein
MSDVWTLGGASLESKRVENLRVKFRAADRSIMTWTVWLKSVDEISTFVPNLRDELVLRRNGSRFFTGWVIGREPLHTAGRLGYNITVVDAWFHLEQVLLSSEVADGAGTEKERAIYLLGAGDLRLHFVSVITRAIDMGIPIQLGDLAECFDVPRMALRNMSFAAALNEMMTWLADGTLWLDHSEAPAVVRLSRRASASTVTVNVGEAVVSNIALKPRLELQVEKVQIAAAKRETVDNRRVTVWEEFSAGESTGILPTRGIVAITGPEINVSMPQEVQDSVYVQVQAFNPTDALIHAHKVLRENRQQPPTAYSSQVPVDPYDIHGDKMPLIPLIKLTDGDGQEIDENDWGLFLVQGEPRDWWLKQGIQYTRVNVTATVAWSSGAELIQPGGQFYNIPEPQWATLVGARQRLIFNYPPGAGIYRTTVWEATLSASVTCVRGVTTGTIIRKEDWGWFRLPPDLADNLLAAQNWMPYEGTVTTIQEEMIHNNPVGSVLNVTGWVPETSTMRGLITGCTVTPRTGQVTYEVGPPLRHAFLDIINRFKQSGSDNFYWLSSPDDDGSGAFDTALSSLGSTSSGGGWHYPTTGGETPSNATLTEDGQVELTEDGQITLPES